MLFRSAYSDRHFYPGKENKVTEWFSCSQIASHMWKVLEKNFVNVTYGDNVPCGKIDLLWTNRHEGRNAQVQRMATFASIAHFNFVTRKISENLSYATDSPVEGLSSIIDKWKHWRSLSLSDLVLIIGNDHILQTFNIQRMRGSLHLVDCGIDTEHFRGPEDIVRDKIFVHNATRFSVRKGSHIVAGAWKKIVHKIPDATLILLGREGDIDIMQLLGNCPRVVFSGAYQSGSSEYVRSLSSSSWVLQPSLAEGQAGTLLEAMSCGCVPLASRSSGIDAEKYGGYPLHGNTIDELAGAMLLAMGEWTPQQSKNVRQKVVEYHNWQLFEKKFLELTLALLERGPFRTPLGMNVLKDFIFFIQAKDKIQI